MFGSDLRGPPSRETPVLARAPRGQRREHREPDEERFVFGKKPFGNADVLVREFVPTGDGVGVVMPRGLKIFAFEGAVDRLFALGSATDGADVAADTGAIAAGLTGFADSAKYAFDMTIVSSGIDAPSGHIREAAVGTG